MICPQCANRNELGRERCAVCGHPFTHDAARIAQTRRRGRRQQSPPVYPTAYAPEEEQAARYPSADAVVWSGHAAGRPPRRQRRRRGRGLLVALVVICVLAVGLVAAALAASNYIVKPMVRDAAVADLRDGVRNEVSSQIVAQIDDAPVGEIILTETEINRRLAASGDLGPIDDVTVSIGADSITVDLSAYGFSGTYQSVIRAENGSIVIDGAQLNGPLSYVIPHGELTEAINAEIAAALAEAGYRVESATMQEGAIALVVTR